MWKPCKTNTKYIFASLAAVLLTAITFITNGKYKNPKPFFKLLTTYTDTTIKDTTVKPDTSVKPVPDTSIVNNSDSAALNDTSGTIVTIDTLSLSKDSLDAQIDYSAEDSGVLIINKKQFMLYGKALA
jgi:hypothetical protein